MSFLYQLAGPLSQFFRLCQPQQKNICQQFSFCSGQWLSRLHQPKHGAGQCQFPHQEAGQVPTCASLPSRAKKYGAPWPVHPRNRHPCTKWGEAERPIGHPGLPLSALKAALTHWLCSKPSWAASLYTVYIGSNLVRLQPNGIETLLMTCQRHSSLILCTKILCKFLTNNLSAP